MRPPLRRVTYLWLATLVLTGLPGIALARSGNAVHAHPWMLLPLLMAVVLAPIVGLQIANTNKYEDIVPWLAGVGVLATVAVSAALFRFGPLVTPIPQIIVLALVVRQAISR